MQENNWDSLWVNANIVTGLASNVTIAQGAIAVKNQQIAWIGRMQDLPAHSTDLIYDVEGACITPGLVDCHTHCIYAGNRANEFELRLEGATYTEIAKQGGGIQSTVRATREATEDELFVQSVKRVRQLVAGGVTTLEIKSGYGLDFETELKMLRVAHRIEAALPVTIVKTFLGAHTIPVEYKNNPDAYVELICEEMIPHVAKKGLALAVDVFCENIAFDLQQTERIFIAAKKNGLAIKCHAEQLSNSGAAKLAAEYNALSVDHLEYLTEESILQLAGKNTVAVLLPGAYYYLRETQMPPIEKLRAHNIPLAIATDCNPGTSPILSLRLIANMACTLFRLTPKEAFLAMTLNAAKALNVADKVGSLAVGMQADFVVWQVSDWLELIYYIGDNPLQYLIKAGEIVDI